MKHVFFTLFVALVALFCVSGCNTLTKTGEGKTETTNYNGEGKVTSTVVQTTPAKTVSVASPLDDKIFCQISNVTGISISSVYDATSAAYAPQIKLLTGGNITMTQDKNSDKLVFGSTTNAGILNSVTNTKAISGSMCLISSKNDDGTGAAKLINAIAKYRAVEVSSDSSATTE